MELSPGVASVGWGAMLLSDNQVQCEYLFQPLTPKSVADFGSELAALGAEVSVKPRTPATHNQSFANEILQVAN